MTNGTELHQQLRQALAQDLVQSIHLTYEKDHSTYTVRFLPDTTWQTIKQVMLVAQTRYKAQTYFNYNENSLVITVALYE